MDTSQLLPVAKVVGADAVVTRHNKLMEAHFYATPQEQRLFLWAVHQAQEHAVGSQVMRVSIIELARIAGVESNGRMYEQMIEVTDRIRRRQVTIKNIETGQLVQANLMNARYEPGDGTVEVEISRFLQPYILQLKNNFTTVELKYAMRLASGHAMRIYDLLKSRQYRGPRVSVTIDELQSLLGVSGKYPRFNNFRQTVLDVACEEINKRTDLDVSFTVTPMADDKRKAGAVVFKVKADGGKVEVPYLPGTASDSLVTRLTNVGLKRADAVRIVEKHGSTDRARILWHLEELQRKYERGDVMKSPAGWLKTGIEEDWRPQRSLFEKEQETARQRRENEAKARKAAAAAMRRDEATAEAVAEATREARRTRISKLVATLTESERQDLADTVGNRLKAPVVRASWLRQRDFLSDVYAKWITDAIKEKLGVDVTQAA